jgi:hypothetical protein
MRIMPGPKLNMKIPSSTMKIMAISRKLLNNLIDETG